MWINHPDVLALKDLLKKHGFTSAKVVDVDIVDDEYDVEEADTDTINTNEDSEHKNKNNNDASDEEEETEGHGENSDDNENNRYALLSNISNE